MIHRINNNEMNPKTECGLELDDSITLATIYETPTCNDCIGGNEMVGQRIRIKGIAAFQSTPAEYMRDMLRYDDGKIEAIWDYPTGKRFESVRFTAIVHLNGYTPERWRSFGLVTDVLVENMVGEYSLPGYTVDEWIADREQPSAIQLDLESAQRVAVRQCLAMHPRVYDGMGLCAQCQEQD